MPQDLEGLLKKQDFTEYEAKTYLAVLRIGRGTARQIGEAAGVPPGRIYEVLKGLAERGFVSIEEGSPTFYRAEEPAAVFNSIRDNYCESINDLITGLKQIQYNDAIPSPFWGIHSERGIQIMLKSMIRNAQKEIIIFVNDPRHLRPVAGDLRSARKRIDLEVLVSDKRPFLGLGLHLHCMGNELTALLEEMHEVCSVMKYDSWKDEFFVLVDGSQVFSIGYQSGNKQGTVITMPTLCYMMRQLIGRLEPDIGPLKYR
ncbi:MAG: helix-turn-helix domain-containing protein [Methanoregula sp.]|jgi:hypothetical protein